jgi:hypothetical protein
MSPIKTFEPVDQSYSGIYHSLFYPLRVLCVKSEEGECFCVCEPARARVCV